MLCGTPALANLLSPFYARGVNVLALQFDIAWENKPSNFQKVRQLLRSARPEKGSLVILPEMFATGFNMNAEIVAEPYGGDTERFLSAAAIEFGVCIIAGAPVRGKDGRARNKAVVFSPNGELAAYYAKMRPFTPGGEDKYYAPGERPICFTWSGWHISPFVCYDLRFPELFRQAAARFQPELFVVIASWPEKRIAHWVRLLQARAIENQAYVVGANRIGSDPSYDYSGRSIIADPDGEILADGGATEGAIQARLDLEILRRYRAGLPFLADMRPCDLNAESRLFADANKSGSPPDRR